MTDASNLQMNKQSTLVTDICQSLLDAIYLHLEDTWLIGDKKVRVMAQNIQRMKMLS